MRTRLMKMDEQRGLFRAVFKKYGLRSGYRGTSAETILLVDVRDSDGNVVCDHLWFNMTKGFEQLGTLRERDMVQFEARVKKYRKGYVNRRAGIDQSKFDYKLSHPTRIGRYRP